MKTAISLLVLAVVTLATLPELSTTVDADIGPQTALEHAIHPVPDEDAEAIRGALAGKWKCAIGSFAIGVALVTTAPATGGVTAIAAPVFFNAAAFCLI